MVRTAINTGHVLTGDEDTTPSVPWKPALPGAKLRVGGDHNWTHDS